MSSVSEEPWAGRPLEGGFLRSGKGLSKSYASGLCLLSTGGGGGGSRACTARLLRSLQNASRPAKLSLKGMPGGGGGGGGGGARARGAADHGWRVQGKSCRGGKAAWLVCISKGITQQSRRGAKGTMQKCNWR